MPDVYLLSIYDKSDYENVSDAFLKDLIQGIQAELNEQDINDLEERKSRVKKTENASSPQSTS